MDRPGPAPQWVLIIKPARRPVVLSPRQPREASGSGAAFGGVPKSKLQPLALGAPTRNRDVPMQNQRAAEMKMTLYCLDFPSRSAPVCVLSTQYLTCIALTLTNGI